ncbi:Rid family detoxifying hydrolase [Devosia sp. YIM 151766]|uniref:Rid family detoxifying hydrolase n=1 Tax=Devosia sp. YIM 151766 TaxID=3017325 RepID=UPI00255C80B1|nr:Rid family detoxifying hydrolase [Devosia sp. YIM 151766]WIY53556.1 Rid family detoxifying hydrolase [Devosia sp. YIM 151766]
MTSQAELEIIKTEQAPEPNVPLSQAVRIGGLVFTSGQVASDPVSGEFVGGDIAVQTARVLDNITAILQAAGSSLDRVIKTTVFLTDTADFGAFNEVYGGYFKSHLPARSTFVVKLAGPYAVEIEAVAATSK